MENNSNISTKNITNTGGTDVEWSFQYYTYTTYVLTGLGLVGNLLSLIVLLLSPKRSKASRLYLIVLAVTDSLVLITGVITDPKFVDKNSILCKLNYVKYGLQSFSAYIVAVIAIQRYVMIKMPFKGPEYDKSKYGIYHLASALVFAFAANAVAVPSLGLVDGICSIKPDYSVLFTYSYLVLNYLCSEVGVGILVLILTILTVQALIKSSKLGISKSGKSDTQLTRMIIVLALTFLVLRLPATIVWLVMYVPYEIMKQPYDDTYNKLLIPYFITATVTLSNFAINFIIYIIFWPAFRIRFVNIFIRGARNSYKAESSTVSTVG